MRKSGPLDIDGEGVEDITTEYKPPRRGRFMINHTEVHEDKKMALY